MLLIILLSVVVTTPSSAQRRVSQGLFEYTTDADGNRHGLYRMFFDYKHRNVSYSGNYVHGIPEGIHKSYDSPGVIGSEVTYRKGKEVEHKYYGPIVKYGNTVRGVYNHEIYRPNGVTIKYEWRKDKNKLVQVMGELPNGKGSWSQIYPEDIEDRIAIYTERYFGNDTTYRWYGYSTDKKQLYRKEAKGYVREYSEDGTVIQQIGDDYGATRDASTGSRTNYKKDVNIDRTLEEWDEDGKHYSKYFYPEKAYYAEESLYKGDNSSNQKLVYTLRTAEDGENARLEYFPDDSNLHKYVLYHNGEKILTYYVCNTLDRFVGSGTNIGSQAVPIFSQYSMVNGSESGLNNYLKSAVVVVREAFPAEVFKKFDFNWTGDIVAMFDNAGNWVVSPYLSQIPKKPADEDFKNLMQEVEKFKDLYADSRQRYGYAKLGDTKYLFSQRTELTAVQ